MISVLILLMKMLANAATNDLWAYGWAIYFEVVLSSELEWVALALVLEVALK